MDIEDLKIVLDQIHGVLGLAKNNPKIHLNTKDFEMCVIALLCELREDNLTIDFKPWIKILEGVQKKDPEKFRIIIPRDETFMLPRECKDWQDQSYKLPFALKSLEDSEYKEVRGEFVLILGGLYSVSEDLKIEHELNSEEYPLPLPSDRDIDNIGNIFGKSF